MTLLALLGFPILKGEIVHVGCWLFDASSRSEGRKTLVQVLRSYLEVLRKNDYLLEADKEVETLKT